MVQENWTTEDIYPFISLKQKMKSLKITLSKWSKDTYGDIFKKFTIREDIVRIKEALFEEFPTTNNRTVLQQAQAELK